MENAISIEALHKSYGSTHAVRDVTLDVPSGTSFGYLGPNGAGKTTTIRCMLGFIRPSAGRITVFGRDVQHALSDVLAETGYLPGEFGLWPAMSGREALDYLGSLHPRPPVQQRDLCERFEMAESALDKQIRFYSRGMKQKIGLIQAFQHGPRLVVLDEPTEGLDPVMKERFVGLLEEHERNGGTTFLSSHILSEVERSTDRVGIIKSGSLVRVGSTGAVTGEHIRRCALTLKEPARADLLDIDGVSNVVRHDPTHMTFSFVGDMEALVGRLGTVRVADLLVQPETLSDAFFGIFEGDA